MEIKKEFSIKNKLSFKQDIIAQYYCEIRNLYDLEYALVFAKKEKLRPLIIGEGSNIIFLNTYFKGLIIKMDINYFKMINKRLIEVGAGMKLKELAKKCNKLGLGGLEKLIDIPGTIGGAIRGNAGASGQEIKDIIYSVSFVNIDNERYTLLKNECNFSYRNSIFKKNKDWIIYSCVLNMKQEESATLDRISEQVIKKRHEKFPLEYPSVGSFFINPIVDIKELSPNIPKSACWVIEKGKVKISAAFLIESCNLKGYRINDVGISEKHALWIINYGDAKIEDLIDLIKIIQTRVFKKYGIYLRPEVELIS